MYSTTTIPRYYEPLLVKSRDTNLNIFRDLPAVVFSLLSIDSFSLIFTECNAKMAIPILCMAAVYKAKAVGLCGLKFQQNLCKNSIRSSHMSERI
jgi:hypothetical protein